MAGTIKHRHQTALVAGGYDVDKNEWNDSLVVAGGSDGDLFKRDTGAGDGWSLVASIDPAHGGTGIASYAVGDLLYASGATTLSKLADVAVGSVLVSGGVTTAPAWSATPSVTSLQVGTGVGVLFGGTSASFPGLKRNGVNLEVRLADDSAASNLLLRNLMNSAGDGLYLAASGQPIVSDANVHQWKVSGTGIVNINGNAFYPSSDNAVDLAGTAPNRFRNAYLGTALVVGTNPATTGAIRLASGLANGIYARNAANTANVQVIGLNALDVAEINSLKVTTFDLAGVLKWGGLSQIYGGFSDGNIVLWSSSQNSFNLLQFGDTANTHPALKRSSAKLQARLADDSAFTEVGASAVGDASIAFRARTSLATPGSLADGDWWVEATGTTPSRVAAIKVRDGGVTRTIASVTY